MCVNISPPLWVGADLGVQPIDIPKLGRGSVGVEQIVDAKRGAPAQRECTVRVEVQFSEALAADLTGGRRGVRARSRHAWEIFNCGGIDARPGGERIVAEIAVIESPAPAAEITQIQRQ